MKLVSFLRRVAPVLLAGVLALPAEAQQAIPQGSYLKSCRQMQVRWGRDLAAFCATRAGEWVVTRLDDFPSCDGDIANQNGQLTCAEEIQPGAIYGSVAPPPRPAPPSAAPVAQRPPAGSYTATCCDLRLEGSWLQASCKDNRGTWREAGLAIGGCPVGNDIANEDGRLKCRSFSSEHAGDYPPPGSYRQTCRDLSLSSGVLRATCLDRRGGWLTTTLYTSWCSGKDIYNDDGGLSCTSPSARAAGDTPVPYGSYMSSCRDISVSFGSLRASCQDRQGFYRTSAPLTLSLCERGVDIVNDNGALRCARTGGGGSWNERPPSGSYMSSCRDVRVVAGWLKATCQDRNGRWIDATTATSWCGAGRDIANIDGRLTCR